MSLPLSTAIPRADDYFTLYITTDDYFAPFPEVIINRILSLVPRIQLLEGLAILNRVVTDHAQMQQWHNEFLGYLDEPTRSRFEHASMPTVNEPRKVILARQLILLAMRAVFQANEPSAPKQNVNSLVAATFLTHAIGARLGEHLSSTDTIGGVDASHVMEVVQNAIFNASDDEYSLMDRYVRLWREFSQTLESTTPRKPPNELLVEATGLDVYEFVALGFAHFASARVWDPSKPLWIPEQYADRVNPRKSSAFLDIVSGTVDEIADSVSGDSEPWNFVAFQSRPILRYDNHLLVLDPDFLLERVLSGMYWLVHDHEKRVHGDDARRLWTQFHGEMVEHLVEDQLRQMSVPSLKTGDTTFYTEEDQKRVFGSRKRATKVSDVALHFGNDICLFEIASGQISVNSRSKGDRQSFIKDTDRLIYKKMLQLDAAAKNILKNEKALTGHKTFSTIRIIPVVVVAFGYPVNPLTMIYIESLIDNARLFDDARIDRLCIVEVSELEGLERLTEDGNSVPTLLRAWQRSTLRDFPLRNYLLHRYPSTGPETYRPSRMKASVDETFRQVSIALGYGADELDDEVPTR